MSLPELLTVKQLCNKHPGFTESGIRKLIFHGSKNGFNHCIVRIGRKILINTEALRSWINNHNNVSSL